jgi:aminopeptidase N
MIRSTGFMLVVSLVLLAVGGIYAEPLHHSLSISLFPTDNSLLAIDSIRVNRAYFEDGQIRFLINKSLVVDDIASSIALARWHTEEDVDPVLFKDDPDSEDVELIGRAKGIFIELAEADGAPETIDLTIAYSGVLYDSLKAPPAAYARGFGETRGLIDERGIYLANGSLWYPFQFGTIFTFALQADVPYPWMTVSQGRLTDEYTGWLHDEDRAFALWVEDNATPEFYLVGGDYYRHETYHEGTRIMTYTYEQSDSLAQVYLNATKRYIAMYESLIGKYPFSKFALVENFWQTGYGMPSFTLLGSRVIRLPFIVHTSYGHEILHNWWGNSVYVDYEKGNWCEGLTTYGADYYYKEQMSSDEARDYRHHTLIAFTNYVTEGKDFPLTDFLERHDAASQSVGYGKSLMVYHMLRKMLGDSLFWACLREFYERWKFTLASWDQVEATFSDVSGTDLTWFFDQWLTRTGAPTVRLKAADYIEEEGRYLVGFTVEQDSPAFAIDLPVRVSTTHGDTEATIRLSGLEDSFTIATGAEPIALSIDPDYDTFRKLYIEEIPLTLGALFGQDSVIVVIGSAEDDSTKAALRQVAVTWGAGDRVFYEQDLDHNRLAGEHVWLLGRGNMVDRLMSLKGDQIKPTEAGVALAGQEFALAGNTVVCAIRSPEEETLGIGLVLSEDTGSLLSLASRIPHYSKYSYLGFAGSRPELRGVWEERRSPLTVDFRER